MIPINMTLKDSDKLATELFKDYPESLLKFSFLSCVILILIGIPGNLITIVALASYRKYRNATAILIINLHVSNLMFCSFVLPLTAVSYSQHRWTFGKNVCNVYALMKFSLIAVDHFTVVAITINRYIMVCHPFKYLSFNKRRNFIITVFSTWILGFGLFFPPFFAIWGRFDLKPIEGLCTMVPDRKHTCPKDFIIALAFFVTYLTMTLCYGRIWWVLRRRTQHRATSNTANLKTTITPFASYLCPASCNSQTTTLFINSSEKEQLQEPNNSVCLTHVEQAKEIHLPTKKDKKLSSMILALLISFAVSHFPLLLIRIAFGDYKTKPVANIFSHLLEYSSSCMSPLIYVCMSYEYRRAYKRLFVNIKTLFVCCDRNSV